MYGKSSPDVNYIDSPRPYQKNKSKEEYDEKNDQDIRKLKGVCKNQNILNKNLDKSQEIPINSDKLNHIRNLLRV